MTNQKITCSNIWKLFGPDEKRIMKDLDPNLSTKEVQEKTGPVSYTHLTLPTTVIV